VEIKTAIEQVFKIALLGLNDLVESCDQEHG